MKLLLTSVIFLPLVTLLMTEKIYNQDKSSKQQAVHWYKEYLFGLLINLTVVQTLKIYVGEPRPHFFEACNPKEASTCTGTEYVSSYTCTKGHWLNQADTSFPSGHTSLAIHASFFLVYYLHCRTRHHQSNIVFVIQALMVVSAVFCAVSRIIDRRHHWWDVLAGAIIAIPILLYTIFSLCRNFDCPVTVPEENNKQINAALLSEQSQ
ncbi:unnamed protein product [Diatraea saccharalis]|uniref:Phosphatidic acid phosphatase type 2/haloperoxidase domain-containing protein n=1 Tax=Diatraea saccharalis TaxID=40085 RepID=A0A9N9RFM6_9NEOP|nr:unnamed protein product [Diatraea saccharalis]